MHLLGFVPLLQNYSTSAGGANADASIGALIVAMLVSLLGGLGFNVLVAWLMSKSARKKRVSKSDVSFVFWISLFFGPLIGYIVLATRKPARNPYGPMPGRPGMRPRGPRPPRRRGPTLPRGMRPYGSAPAHDPYGQQQAYAPPPQAHAAPAYAQQAVPAPTQAPPGFLFCPRCGQQNGVQRDDCWSCGLGFHPSIKPDYDEHQPVAAPPPAEAFGAETVRQAPAVGEETVVRHDPQRTERLLKVACNACGKKFSGPESKIARVKACPRCGATPFEYTQL